MNRRNCISAVLLTHVPIVTQLEKLEGTCIVAAERGPWERISVLAERGAAAQSS
jgi:hypothetical protein